MHFVVVCFGFDLLSFIYLICTTTVYHENTATKRYSNPSLFDPKCLSPTGKRQLIKPLPKGWEECFITDQHEVLDMGVQQDVSQLDNFIHLPEIDSEFQKTLDLGRTYYYHKETGAVSFMPPPGSTKLAMEAFKNYGHIGLRQR